MFMFPETKKLIKEDPASTLKWCLEFFTKKGIGRIILQIAVVLRGTVMFLQGMFIATLVVDFKTKMDVSKLFTYIIMTVLKMISILCQSKRVNYFYKTIEEEFWDHSIGGRKIELNIRQRFASLNKVILYYFAYVNGALLYYCYNAMTRGINANLGKRNTLILIWSPWDIHESPLYEITCPIFAICLFISTSGSSLFTLSFHYWAQHLHAQLKLLEELLKNLTTGVMEGTSDVDKFKSNEFQKIVFRRIKICVNQHNILIKFEQELSQFSSEILGLLIVVTYELFIIGGFLLLSIDSTSLSKYPVFLNILIISLFDLVGFCIVSSDLDEMSLKVADAAYDTKWYLFQVPLKKGLISIMMISQRGIKIKAGKLIELNRKLIVSVLQNAFSCISLLRTLTE